MRGDHFFRSKYTETREDSDFYFCNQMWQHDWAFFFPWLPKRHCSRIQKDAVSLHLFAWKRKTDRVDIPTVMFLKSTPLQSANIHPGTFKHRKDPADENNCFLLVLLHKNHTCRAAREARKATTGYYCDIQATLYRSFYYTCWTLHWAKWCEPCSCCYSYPPQHRARACLPLFDLQTTRGWKSTSFLILVVKRANLNMAGVLAKL